MRPAAAGVALGLALAVGVPTAWELTRPPAAAGAPVEQALAATPTPTPTPTTAPPPSPAVPQVTTRDAAPSPAAQVVPPVRVEMPARGLDVPVDAVGTADDGQMAIPDDVDRAGWYRFGPAPGAAGSAVVAGHVDDVEQGLGAMAALRAAEPGDEVLVTDAAGAVTRWRVLGRELLDKGALPVDDLFRRDGPPRLTLVTCGGPFLPDLGGYRDNLVVVAEPAP
ncbi:class F sortase [Geodermatophilus nigrescens]|uniref:Sortase family protein n=1 Tax=Geodermatophilus nigrescens TaxID=1070870 RepID=A0A1M5CQR3_9ACTN|nr:class F sortase [Geodermatophilus nigrescens]SHF57094.1 Sortase family protein [Geodermatophilus nigrescens]